MLGTFLDILRTKNVTEKMMISDINPLKIFFGGGKCPLRQIFLPQGFFKRTLWCQSGFSDGKEMSKVFLLDSLVPSNAGAFQIGRKRAKAPGFTLPEANSLPLKVVVSKKGLFSVVMLVSGRVAYIHKKGAI